MCKHVYETLSPVIWHKGRHIVWVFMATTRQVLEKTMSLAQAAARELQCRSQAMTPKAFGLSRQVVHKKQLRAERVALMQKPK